MKKFLSILLAALMVAALLAGCSGSSDSGTTAAAETKAAETEAAKTDDGGEKAADSGEQVTIYVTDWENDQMNAAIQQACDDIFTKEHPNIKVEILAGSYSDYGQQITAMIQAGDNLDIFQQGYDQGATRYDQGMLLDITDRLAAEPDFEAGFYPGAMDGWKTKDHVYGLPGLANVYGCFYNKDLLKEKGLDEPTTDWTWDDLWALAEACKDTSNETYGLYNFDTGIFGVTQLGVSEGGQPYIDKPIDPTGVTVDDKLVAAVEKIRELVADGTLPDRNYEGSDLQSQFEAGTMPLLWYGQWEINSLIQNPPDFEWGYAPSPKGSVTGATMYDFTGWCIKKDCKYPDEAWEVLKFLASEGYGPVLKVTPVAACAHESTAQVFFDTVKEAGHPEAADAVENMMARDYKVAVRFGGAFSDDASKVWDVGYNDLINNGGDDFNGVLQDLAKQVNAIIEAEQ